ncbi:MmcQ/YjbR family DNA-binding protein [Micromonospora sp. CPCC 205371]|nr:MmcQ/YjbR family DNA-binding protein [Micromonospora sp. CPCC 205371]
MVTVEAVRRVALALPRTSEHLIRDRIKFRVGQIVYVAFSRDETTMGFGYPKEERAALIAAEPEKFFPPSRADERFNWVQAWMAALDEDEMRELVIDAWRMCVPKRVAREWEEAQR